MTNFSKLPKDLVEEILSRVPVESRSAVRLTCKKWNTITKDVSFVEKHVGKAKVASAKAREFMVIMIMDFRVYLTSVNLHGEVISGIKHEAKFTSLDDSYVLDVVRVIHCDGLLLYIMKDDTKLMIWNPYCGKPRWIRCKPSFYRPNQIYSYALGYERQIPSCRRHKILRFIKSCDDLREYKIYDFNSDIWRVHDDVTPDKKIYIPRHSHGVSLKGNTYWYAEARETDQCFVYCFDFTRERFGPPMSLPLEFWKPRDLVTLSSFREEQLAVLHQPWETLMMEFWITTKIEPNAVSWNNKVFLTVKATPPFSYYEFACRDMGFFIDEEKKVVVLSDKGATCDTPNVVYVQRFACFYVPSSVQL